MADDETPELPDATPEPAPEETPVPSGDVEADARAASERSSGDRDPSGRARAVTVISLRIVRGLAGIACALVVIGAVGLVPLPTVGIEPLEVTVEPQPADLLAACDGALLQLGDDSGEDADRLVAVGQPRLTTGATGGEVERSQLAVSDAGTGGTAEAPAVLRVAAGDGAALAGAQSQRSSTGALRGLATSSCAEPSSSAWLVGGATTVGRTTLLLLTNPTEVTAEVSIELWGESGPVTAPGMSGITVAAGAQRVLPLAGFAPGLASPVVHVEARGGQVVAALETTVTRVLDPSGVDLLGAGSAPAENAVIPGVRIFDALGVSSSLGLADFADLEAAVRVGNPGDTDARVEVGVVPTDPEVEGASFELPVPAGTVVEVPLSSASDVTFPDGSYTVTIRSDEPVVAGVRASTSVAPTTDEDGDAIPGAADLAWFAAADPLAGDETLLAVADGPGALIVVTNPDGVARTVSIEPLAGGEAVELTVPANGSAVASVADDLVYRLSDVDGLRVAVTFASPGMVAGYLAWSPRVADSSVVIRP